MRRGLLIRGLPSGWAKAAHDRLLPGGHACVFGGFRVPLEGEDQGFEVRDCLVVLGSSRETVWLLRKPLSEGTVAAQVLKTGTGALWIDGCRVAGIPQVPSSMRSYRRFDDKGDKPDLVEPPSPNALGRWPSNLVLVHGPKCKQRGTKRVKGHKGYPNGPGGKSFQYSSDKRGSEVRPNAWLGHSDAEGLETIPAWVCQPGCPVLAMDTQSGVSTSGAMRHEVPAYEGESTTAFLRGRSGPSNQHGGTGGASRFFSQFANDEELDEWLTRLMLGPG